jgi:hypothetical protein
MSPFIRRPSVRHTDRVLARSVLFLVLAVYVVTAGGLPENPDGEIEFQTVSAFARTGELAIGGTPEAETILEYARAAGPGECSVVEGIDGQYYAWFGVGQAAVALPFYYVGQFAGMLWPEMAQSHRDLTHYGLDRSEYFEHLAVGLRNPLLGALTAWLLVLICRRLGAERLHAWLGGLTYGLTTFAWPQARASLSDVQATFFIVLAFHLILQTREHYDRLDVARKRELFAIGGALGMAFLTRVAVLPVCLVLCIAAEVMLANGVRRISVSRWSPKRAGRMVAWRVYAIVALPFLACIGVFLATNEWRFGDPFDPGYGLAVWGTGFLGQPTLSHLAGLLVSPGRGLLWLAPGVLLVPWGLALARTRGERFWMFTLAGVAIATIVPAAMLRGWHGAWTYGPRYLLPLLPFLWIGVALSLAELGERRARRILIVCLFLFGLMVQVPAALVDHMTHQDLAVQAARSAWPAGPEIDTPAEEREIDEQRFERIQWDWGFAAPWAHWRILRHRVAGLGESFEMRDIFRVDVDGHVVPLQGREMGFRHLAWVDLVQRLGGSAWPSALSAVLLFLAGVVLSFRGLDHSAP